ncbi:EAL domain-containing protein [Erythrobacter sp. JK5]|uniref:EAL domain-containing protein n=1 Tax=Erythrobacter sp. JK5 TaxID=2829500 RepID=UPI001BAA5456|nr:EAL domain-containing protein [Erythrobacter sp. JK5]QUL36765.1 EAL domain-containing protein [Erythrobacter sp. JK5]
MWLARFSRETKDAHIGAVALVAALLVAIALIPTGGADGFEANLRDGRDQLRVAPASGEIAIVEIDGRSLQALEKWPWPRRYHAQAIRELDRLGAEQIAFDVDFSARSTPQDDAALAAAFAEIGQPAIVPTFRQVNRAGELATISEAMPIPEFRQHTFVASVNVFPSANGRVIDYPNGIVTGGVARPSLVNMLARTGGEVESSFRIDQAIDPATIPRISFIDLIEGRVPREDVAGRRVVIGATAIELFDRYPTAFFGVQPGVAIQVQAAETLLQDRVRSTLSQWAMLAVAVVLLAGFLGHRARSSRGASSGSIVAGGVAAAMALTALVLDQATGPYLPLTAPLMFLVAFVIARRTLSATVDLQTERLTDTASGLLNRVAMSGALKRRATAAVAVARIADFGDVIMVLGATGLAEMDRAIARRLRLLTGVETVYRLESGVFAWFMPDTHAGDPEDAFETARTLFNAPFEIGEERFRLSVHFGSAAGSIADAESASELARKRGLSWSANAGALQEETQFRQRLLGELDDALANGAISVVYQPKLRLADGAIADGECLVRWDSAQLGRISPTDFIPILEAKGRIRGLTLFVLDQALARRDQAAVHGHALNLAVNVSAQLLSDGDFIAAAVGRLERAATGLGGITLEITESAPLVDSDTARSALERLHAAGARISIDDYGTGQASLNYLQGFPAQEIKLDQSFIRNLVADRKDQIMVQSTIDLAHALGFVIVAEGVEDAEALAILRERGCDYAQGWEIGRPMPWRDFAAMLRESRQYGAAA